MKTKSFAVEIIYSLPKDKETKCKEEYRVETSEFISLKALMRNQIDSIDKIYKLKNIISIKFTG